MQQNLRRGRFRESIAGKPPATLDELLVRAEKYIRIEETSGGRGTTPLKRRAEDEGHSRRPLNESNQRERRRIPPSDITRHTPLSAPRAEILAVAEQQGIVQWPSRMRENPKRMKSDKYCLFHKDRGHGTEDCFHLKDEIEKLIRREYLKEYVNRSGQLQEKNSRPPQEGREREDRRNKPTQDNLPTTGIIGVISGGPAGGDSARARKAALRAIANTSKDTFEQVVMMNEKPQEKQDIVFGNQDLEKMCVANNDAVVISVTIANFWVKKVLVDSGSSADIIFHKAFSQMGINNVELTRINTPLTSFSGNIVEPIGEVTLPISLGSYPRRATKMIKFLVVDAPSAYNVILGRPSLNSFQAIASTYHLKLKFPTLAGIGEEIGDRRQARECYANSLKGESNNQPIVKSGIPSKKKTTITTDKVPTEKSKEGEPQANKKRKVDEERIEPTKEVKAIELTLEHVPKITKIGTLLDPQFEKTLIAFLQEKINVFAWDAADMSGIDPKIMVHRLNLNPKIKPVKQKKRAFGNERIKVIKEEVEKLLRIDYIRPVQYPEWLANVVLVPKPNGKWRMCIDFTDLNKACPKDSYPLPRIDALIDSTSGCELMSFLDAFQGYNQIRLAHDDQEKTSFLTDQGIFCYNVMPFGLKNTGATYQRLVNNMFREQIGRNMEVYIDDMMVKSQKKENHKQDLQECFGILQHFGMKLNPTKCTFGVHGGNS
ncbi:Transposon Ty3-G Gag-Pol polyprotein [Sesamum angolense]|uniref:Transposon Ty3-G Gag-Pol polyprotein n=1 Tax=Sesamum angolense TaxID=2727404 RepID=A0AAE2BZ47_9LAMI|nr:Transposon Ty3-G Gag-Pol polyprotein [Sesamum angolense]